MKEVGRSLVWVVASASVLYGLHRGLFGFLPGSGPDFSHYSLETLYVFFTVCSIVVMTVVHLVQRRNPDVVGMSFLLVSTLKMIGAGIFASPLLSADALAPVEKANFIAVFILFLTMETVLTIRILNKKQ